MSYLVVVSHPDDEVLGAGATIYKLTQLGYEVNICIMCGQAAARNLRPTDDEFTSEMHEAIRCKPNNYWRFSEYQNEYFSASQFSTVY